MKKNNLLLILALLTIVLMLPACRTAPVYNVHNAGIPTTQNAPMTMEKVTAAIIKAGGGLGWNMRPIKPGLIEATLNIRAHQAIVNITYDEANYNIDYKSSNNLKYNGTKIHSNYNGWIQNLSRAINNQLATAQYE